MNRRNILSLSAIMAVGVALLPGAAISQQKSLKDQLVGAWTPVSWEQVKKDGSKFNRFGSNMKGFNVFDANGHFYLMFARSDLPKIASNNVSTPTPEEAKAIATGMIAYYGTYTVDEGTKTIILRIEASSLPNQLGMDQKRAITSISPTELKYTNSTIVGGDGQINVTLKRAN